MTFEAVLMMILTGGMLVPIVGYIINVWEEDVRPLNKGEKRLISVLLAGVMGLVSYVTAIYAGYWINPLTTANWVNAVGNDIVTIVAANYGVSQVALSLTRSDFAHKVIGSKNRYEKKEVVLAYKAK